MKKQAMQIAAFTAAAAITFANINVDSHASTGKVSSVLPQAGITYALGNNQVSLSNLQQSLEEDSKNETTTSISGVSKSVVEEIASSDAVTDETPSASNITDSILKDIQSATGAVIDKETEQEKSENAAEEERFKTLVIAKVDNYVNVRDIPSEDGEIVGKLYDKSVGTFIEEENGWYKIKSGKVEGYVKGEFCVTGEEAVELAKKVGTRMATVTTTTLFVRSGPSTDDSVIGYVPIEDELTVTEELDGWVKVNIEEGDGYVSRDYVTLHTEFVEAESKAEEEARLAKEKAAREAANKAAEASLAKSKNNKENQEGGGDSGKTYKSPASYTTESSSIGAAVAQYAQQFVGNPYVYGGSSLTNGTDCSGFVMSVYANFGVSLPHSSGADRSQGAAVDGLANAQPGDIICYSGHVGIYIGGGQIVHASTAKTGIKISDASYRPVLAVRRIF